MNSTYRGPTVDVDKIIEKLLSVRGTKPIKKVSLLESEITGLVTAAREILISQPIFLELEAPIKVCGSPFFHIIPL